MDKRAMENEVETGGWLQRLADYFFGYDFFLSYSHGDG